MISFQPNALGHLRSCSFAKRTHDNPMRRIYECILLSITFSPPDKKKQDTITMCGPRTFLFRTGAPIEAFFSQTALGPNEV